MSSIIKFRPYQKPIFTDRKTGTQLLHWSRQIGKSFTLGSWSVDRLLTNPGRLVTVLSNSRDNGAELNLKCAEVCQKLDQAFEQEDLSPDLKYENMNMETRVRVGRKTGRIKVLAANPRTARGFSGDLIMDEFAFHENSNEIWEAAEPMLSSNPDFLCRIASTGNGRYNMFYRMATGGLFPVSRVTRTDAWKQGVKIYHPITREPITPEEARRLALDKRAYDQNYECMFADENMALLTHELISAAEDLACGTVLDHDWTHDVLDKLKTAVGPLYIGVDVGRKKDLTVITVMEKLAHMYFVRAVLRIQGMRLPQQQDRLAAALSLPKFAKCCIDMTGIGLGLCEYTQEQFGQRRVVGINFSSTVPITDKIKLEGRKQETVKVTEAMATELLQVYEDRRIRQPYDEQIREDLRKPEKQVSTGGRVSIAATRDESGHADHFWSFALAIEAAQSSFGPFNFKRLDGGKSRHQRPHIARRKGVLI